MRLGNSAAFCLFLRLPPEIRHQIWRLAFEEDWGFVALRRDGRRLKFVGSGRQVTRQTCREAREVMKLTHTYIEGLGWVDFAHLLFYFKDDKADYGLMKRAYISRDILPHIRHLVLNPVSRKRMYETIERVIEQCTSLQTLVMIGPWPDPPPPVIYDYGHGYDPHEAWEPIFKNTPAEADVTRLVDAVRHGEAGNAEFYKTKLEQAWALEQELHPNIAQTTPPWGWALMRLQRPMSRYKRIADGKATVCLVRRDELDPRRAFMPWDAVDHIWLSHEGTMQREERLQRERENNT